MKCKRLFTNIILLTSLLSSCDFPIFGNSSNSSAVPDEEQEMSLVISDYPKELVVGENYQLVADVTGIDDYSIIWESSSLSVLNIDEDGVVTGLSKGTAVIYASLSEDTSIFDSVSIKVVEEGENASVLFDQQELVLDINQTFELSVSVTGVKDKSVVFESLNKAIASVDENGLVTGLNEGRTQIQVSLANYPSINDLLTVQVIKGGDSIKNPDSSKYVLNWHDEFDGTSLNEYYWAYQEGDGSDYGIAGWGNGEQQWYTRNNLSFQNGHAVITAKKESMGTRSYTSCKIVTAGNVAFTYGRVEARMKLPAIEGLWPAFWLMPQNSVYGGWPKSGEIDIMEARGRISDETSSALHFADENNGHKYLTGTASLSHTDSDTIDDWHIYAVEWNKEGLKFFVDNFNFFAVKNQQLTGLLGSEGKPFDQSFYVIFNLAVGGHFDSYRNPSDSDLPASMEIDYVRWWGLKS